MERDLRDLIGLTAGGVLLCGAFLGAMYRNDTRQLPKPEVLSRAGNTANRTQTWAEAVTECEQNGGVAVPRATTVLGRSADLPACVPQLGD